MEADLIFHNVGQGLFYTGQIRCNDKKFNFVYDCGTISGSTQNPIKQYKKYLNNDVIDMLVISHFHEDHTSGIASLLHKQTVKTVVIPYYSFEERLEILLKEYSSKMSSKHCDFLLNPYKFFSEKGVKKIIVVKHSENIDVIDIGTEFLIDEDIPMDSSLDDFEEIRELTMHISAQISVVEDTKLFKWKGCFSFAFYADGKHKIKFQRANAPKEIDALKQATNKASRENAIKNLQKNYNVKTQILNETSLIMVHKFDAKLTTIYPYYQNIYSFQNLINYLNVFHFTNDHIHILTGDFHFNSQNTNASWQDVKNHFGSFLNATVSIKQISHHGSIDNWDKNILNHTAKKNICVVPYGTKNIYGHPSIDVIKDILNAQEFLCEVTETHNLILLYR